MRCVAIEDTVKSGERLMSKKVQNDQLPQYAFIKGSVVEWYFSIEGALKEVLT